MADEITFRPHVVRAIRERPDVRVEPYHLSVMNQQKHGFLIYSGKKEDGDYRTIFSSPLISTSDAEAELLGHAYIDEVMAMTPQQISDLERTTTGGNGHAFGLPRELRERP